MAAEEPEMDIDAVVAGYNNIRTALEWAVKTAQDLTKRVEAIDKRLLSVDATIALLRNQVEYTGYQVDAGDHLKEWMMEEKDKDATDFPMSKKELQAGLEDYMRRSGATITDD